MQIHEGMRVTVMGLGLHGGGAAAARYCASRGATVTVTDLKDEEALASSLSSLADLPLRYVLGRHEEADFTDADLVIKNPAVPRTARYLRLARRIETDISIFLRECPLPIIAVTGTKGKSTSATAIHHGLTRLGYESYLGGNITISPLTFAADIDSRAEGAGTGVVVLEISSFQLGDLLLTSQPQLLRPRVAVITNIFEDHQDYYGSMDAYVADKRIIYRYQRSTDLFIYNADDAYGPQFAAEAPSTCRAVSAGPLPPDIHGAYLDSAHADGGRSDPPRGIRTGGGVTEELLPQALSVSGQQMRINLLTAALAMEGIGADIGDIGPALADFAGIEHRLETVGERNGVLFVNDSAATIPDAALRAVESFDRPVYLIAGGSDKNGSFDIFPRIVSLTRRTYLLAGGGTDRIRRLLPSDATEEPFTTLRRAVEVAYADACRDQDAEARGGGKPGTQAVVLLSPGCASFGMFQNEFDRGRRFMALTREIIGRSESAADP